MAQQLVLLTVDKKAVPMATGTGDATGGESAETLAV
jgi:hypothetical protein